MTRRRRRAATLVAAALATSAGAQVPDWSIQAQERLRAGPEADPAQAPAERQRLVAQGEACLAAGAVDCARRAFEQAALIAHAADIEIGIVRAQMQAGEYRQALAFAAHTAGAHRESPSGRRLYAQLLRQGGQIVLAQRLLDDVGTGEAAPGRPVEGDAGFAPYPVGDAAPPQARVIGSAVLLPDGRQAVTSQGLVGTGTPTWLRDGLGRTVRAELVRSDTGSGLALLQLARPLGPTGMALAARDPFPGVPGYVVAFAPSTSAAAAWPQLSPGFLGRYRPGGGDRWLGIDNIDSEGAPVFDGGGQLAGISLPAGTDGRLRLGSIGALRALAGYAPDGAPALPARRAPVDEIYEQALRSALQVLAEP